MSLYRLVYISDSSRPMSPSEIGTLVKRCRLKNEARGISGLLLYGGSHFMQVLEGDSLRVSVLFDRISADPRHTNVQRLIFKPAQSRMFGGWGLCLVDTSRVQTLNRERIENVLIRLRLSNNGQDAAEAMALLREFQDQLMRESA